MGSVGRPWEKPRRAPGGPKIVHGLEREEGGRMRACGVMEGMWESERDHDATPPPKG